jgi:hypothetical protein
MPLPTVLKELIGLVARSILPPIKLGDELLIVMAPLPLSVILTPANMSILPLLIFGVGPEGPVVFMPIPEVPATMSVPEAIVRSAPPVAMDELRITGPVTLKIVGSPEAHMVPALSAPLSTPTWIEPA